MGNQKNFLDGEKYQGEENNFRIILLLLRGTIDLYKNPTQQIDFRKWLGDFGAKTTSKNLQNMNLVYPRILRMFMALQEPKSLP